MSVCLWFASWIQNNSYHMRDFEPTTSGSRAPTSNRWAICLLWVTLLLWFHGFEPATSDLGVGGLRHQAVDSAAGVEASVLRTQTHKPQKVSCKCNYFWSCINIMKPLCYFNGLMTSSRCNVYILLYSVCQPGPPFDRSTTRRSIHLPPHWRKQSIINAPAEPPNVPAEPPRAFRTTEVLSSLSK